MEIFLTYLKVFAIGGLLCAIAQLIMIKTKITPSRILVGFLIVGALLQAFGWFEPLKQFAAAGVTVPILGFGAAITKGAMEAVKTMGILGAFAGGLTATAIGVGSTVVFSFIAAMIFKPRTEK